MYKITKHPILDIAEGEKVEFIYDGKKVVGQKGYTIAAALHQAGFPVHSHSLDGRNRSLNCGIGKCGACEMLVDGKIRRICITLVDGVKEVKPINNEANVLPDAKEQQQREVKVYKTQVAIVGAGPAGLACREQLNAFGISNIVVDNNPKLLCSIRCLHDCRQPKSLRCQSHAFRRISFLSRRRRTGVSAY